MLIMVPYCFHIGIAIGFTICESKWVAVRKSWIDQQFDCTFVDSILRCLRSTADMNTIIHDNKALGVIGLYNCIGGFLALPIGRVSDTVRTY